MNPSRNVPEGVDTVTAEGKDLALAIATAAESIGVDPKRVEFKYDLEHFRSSMGTSIAKKTVKIIAWNTTKSDEELEAEAEAKPKAKPRKERSDDRSDRGDRSDRAERRSKRGKDKDDRRSKDRDDRRGRGRKRKEDEDRPDPDELDDTEASQFAHAWFVELIGKMGIEGEVKSGGTDDRVLIWVSADRAGRLIGKRGSTLGAIRHLLGLMVSRKFGELTIDVDVADNRPRDDRKPKRDRGERKERSGGGGNDKRYPEEKLKALARRAAEKALETGKTITINLELNSYDRRIVHVEVAEVDGVESRSELTDDGTKIIQVVPEGDED